MIYLIKGICGARNKGDIGIIQTVMTFLGQFKGPRLFKLQKTGFGV